MISQELQTDVDQILPIVKAAELLGFVKVSDGECEVTEIGAKLTTSRSDIQKQIIKERISRIEPFATALQLAEESPEGFTAEDVAEKLSKKGNKYCIDNIDELHELLVDWLLYTELLEYDGDSRTFKKVSA